MELKDNYLRKILVAGVGALDLGYEKLGEIVDECVKRGEITVEKGRTLNEELKHKCEQVVSGKEATIDVESLSAEERAKVLEKLLAMQETEE